MNIKNEYVHFRTLRKIYVFCMYLQVFDRICVRIWSVYARICTYCTYLHVSMRLTLFRILIRTNTRNTCKYWLKYVHIRTPNTYKYISLYLHVYDAIMMLYACIWQYVHVFTNSRLLEWWENYVHGQYLYVYECICMYLDRTRQYDSEFSSIAPWNCTAVDSTSTRAHKDTLFGKKLCLMLNSQKPPFL